MMSERVGQSTINGMQNTTVASVHAGAVNTANATVLISAGTASVDVGVTMGVSLSETRSTPSEKPIGPPAPPMIGPPAP